MLATANSRPGRGFARDGKAFSTPRGGAGRGWCDVGFLGTGGRLLFLMAMLGFWFVVPGRAAAEASAPAALAKKNYTAGRERFRANREDPEEAWNFARACFDWADYAANREQRGEIASEGVEAARGGIEKKPGSAECHYYLALNLGQLARARHLGALKLVREMEREFKTAIGLNPKLDFAGPHRALGTLYRDAPGWPASIGSRAHAKEQLELAVGLFPGYPENRLALAEGLAKWGDKHGAEAQVRLLKEIWPKARAEFSGENWSASWVDWNERWEKLLKAAAGHAEPKPR